MWDRVIIVGNNLRDHRREGIIQTKTTQGWPQASPKRWLPARACPNRLRGKIKGSGVFYFRPGRVLGCGASPHGSLPHGGHKPCEDVER